MTSKLLSALAASIVLCGCGSDTEPVPIDLGGNTADGPEQPAEQASLQDKVALNEDTSTAASSPPPAAKAMGKMAPMKFPAPEDMVFKDEIESNVEAPKGLDGLVFIDTKNNRVQLSQYLGKKHVVLVFTEGFGKMLCPFCKTHTARLVANYEKFSKLNAEVLVVYPGERDHLEEFIQAARAGQDQVDQVPFPIVLDQKLSAVDHFDIRSQLAHPSTYVIDKQGNTQLAYVGQDMSPDRPSIKALLETLERAEQR
ncbi:MAG: peroxiredoxin family protein [Planctomycetaceae bacterium]